MCTLLDVPHTSFCDWEAHIPTAREFADRDPLKLITDIHVLSRRTYGGYPGCSPTPVSPATRVYAYRSDQLVTHRTTLRWKPCGETRSRVRMDPGQHHGRVSAEARRPRVSAEAFCLRGVFRGKSTRLRGDGEAPTPYKTNVDDRRRQSQRLWSRNRSREPASVNADPLQTPSRFRGGLSGQKRVAVN